MISRNPVQCAKASPYRPRSAPESPAVTQHIGQQQFLLMVQPELWPIMGPAWDRGLH